MLSTNGALHDLQLTVAKKLELYHNRPLSEAELALLQPLDDHSLHGLMPVHQHRDQSVEDFISGVALHARQQPICAFAHRVVSLWLMACMARFFVATVEDVNILRFVLSHPYSPVLFLGILPLLWRYNDQNSQRHAPAYRRLSDLTTMQLGEAVELLTRRYVFAMFAVTLILGQCSQYYYQVNYFYLLDCLLFAAYIAHTGPALLRDAKEALLAEHYTMEHNLFLEIPMDMYQAVQGLWQLQNRLWDGVRRRDLALSQLLVMHPKSTYEVWRYAELGVHAVGAVPRHVSPDYLRCVLFAPEEASRYKPSMMDWLQGAMNTLDGRAMTALLHCHTVVDDYQGVYGYRRKLTTLQRGFALLLEQDYLMPLLYSLLLPRYTVDADWLKQFSRRMILYIQQDARLQRTSIAYVDLCSRFKPHPLMVQNFVDLCLRSDLYQGQQYRYQHCVNAYVRGEMRITAQAMMIVRDLAFFIAVGEDSYANISDLLYFIGHLLKSAASMAWSEDVTSQRAVAMVFEQLGDYVAHPRHAPQRHVNLSFAVGRLAALTQAECEQESPNFYWALFDCLNFMIHMSGTVDMVCSDAFKKFLAGRLLTFLGPDEIDWMKKVLGVRFFQANRAALVCHFLDTMMTIVDYDVFRCFQESFVDSVELNDMLRSNASYTGMDADFSYMDVSRRFVQVIIRFIARVEHRQRLRARMQSGRRQQAGQNQSLIYCLGMIFQYYGNGRIYGAERLARLMHQSLLAHPGYVKWTLTFVDILLLVCTLCRAPFYRRDRKDCGRHLYQLGADLYFFLTRMIVYLPLFVFFSLQFVLIALGTLFYNLGRERVFVLGACGVVAMAFVHAWFLPAALMPIFCAFFYFLCVCLLHAFDDYISPKLRISHDGVMDGLDSSAFAMPFSSTMSTMSAVSSDVIDVDDLSEDAAVLSDTSPGIPVASRVVG